MMHLLRYTYPELTRRLTDHIEIHIENQSVGIQPLDREGDEMLISAQHFRFWLLGWLTQG